MKKVKILTFLSSIIFIQLQAQQWEFQSSSNQKIDFSWKATQQTASMVMDVDKDGVDDIIIANRTTTPSLVWMKFERSIGWREFALDKDLLTIEAGGAFYDIDKDGDNDIVFGGDYQSNKIWWWENPYPYFNPNVRWNRYEIKNDGQNQHHDQVFGDFKQNGKAQLAFWNQGDKTLYLAEIPESPKTKTWTNEAIFKAEGNPEGCTAADVDGDGYKDLIAGNYWFKYTDGKFKPIKFGSQVGRVVAAKFRAGKRMQIVVSSGDGIGKLMYYECNGNAEVSENWKAKVLIDRGLSHAHTLEAADINDDGNLDVFVAEMAKWTESKTEPDNPNAEAFILYGDGLGNFRKEVFQKGIDFHEGRVYDLDNDGDMDIVSKPYNWNAPRFDAWLQNGMGEKLPKIAPTLEKRIGLELYSLRDDLAKDVPSTLAYVKSLGITEVEIPGFYGLSPEKFKAELDKAGLVPYSLLLGFDDFKDSLSKVIKLAKASGVKYVGTAWIPHQKNQFTKETADKAIAIFNKAGEALAKEGLHFFYHCHGYEFRPSEDGTIFDYIVKKTNAANVSYEIDVYWAFHGGQDPALLLKKHKGRILALHLKDMKNGQETGELSGNTPLTSDVALGTGQLNFSKILRTAIQTNVKYYYIEDENAEVKEHLPVSLRYLRGLK